MRNKTRAYVDATRWSATNRRPKAAIPTFSDGRFGACIYYSHFSCRVFFFSSRKTLYYITIFDSSTLGRARTFASFFQSRIPTSYLVYQIANLFFPLDVL